MARYSSWKGYLKISLVSFPVKAYTAGAGGASKISLNQLHSACHNRIKYQKTCPVHGEVASEEIVSGYEYAKGQYVVIDTDELDKLRTESDKSISVDTFVPSDAIDPLYHSGKTYYLVPDGPVGQKPYQLVHQAMLDQSVQAVARVVISRKEELVLVRPVENLLAMTVLNYHSEVKEPASFNDEIVASEANQQELDLTNQLIGALTKSEIDLTQYKDIYTEKLTQLIEAKVQGKEVVAVSQSEEPHVINLMDAIKASMEQIKVPAAGAAKPERKMAASKTARQPAAAKKAASKKRKSG